MNREAIYQQMLRDQEESLVKRQKEHERAVMEDEQIAKFGRELALRDEQRKAVKANFTEKREHVQREVRHTLKFVFTYTIDQLTNPYMS